MVGSSAFGSNLVGANRDNVNPKKKAAKAAPVTAREVQELKDAVAAQQQQIQQLMQQMQARDAALQQAEQQMQQAQQAASAAQAKADQASQQASQQQQDVSSLKTDVTDIKQNATAAALSLQETQKNIQSSLDNPIAIHFKGVTITPGGFLAAETVLAASTPSAPTSTRLSTPFPCDGATAYHMSEFFGSGRQSRISMLAEGKLATSSSAAM